MALTPEGLEQIRIKGSTQYQADTILNLMVRANDAGKNLQEYVDDLEAQLTQAQGRIAELEGERHRLLNKIDFLTAPLFCGHPSSCLTSTDQEGYCGWCADRGK